jgi:LmbE family N-acetylglucosaminyl deacetylase
VLHLDYFDAVYRASADGQWLYPDVKALYGDVHPHDPLALEGSRELADHLGERIRAAGETTVYAPLTAGRHVDHQVVHAAARRLMEQGYRLAFYEDYPYAQQPEVVKAALASVGGERWSAEIRGLDPLDLAAKVSAVGYYHTQMSVLFGGAEGMPSPIWTFAATRSPDAALAERIWWPG